MRLVVAFAGIVSLLLVAAVVVPCILPASELPQTSHYSLLEPIRSGNLTVFPVVSNKSYDTGEFITLDEGIRSGDVVITEAGQARGLIRRRTKNTDGLMPPVREAEVNRLVLVNNSKRPLLLLAGEVVTGGKQDRVIGKDRIVPPESDPVDLSVFLRRAGAMGGGKRKGRLQRGQKRRDRWLSRLTQRSRQRDGREESAAGMGQRQQIEGGNGVRAHGDCNTARPRR